MLKKFIAVILIFSISSSALSWVFAPSLVSALATAVRSPSLITPAVKSVFATATSPKVALALTVPAVFGSGSTLVNEGSTTTLSFPDGQFIKRVTGLTWSFGDVPDAYAEYFYTGTGCISYAYDPTGGLYGSFSIPADTTTKRVSDSFSAYNDFTCTGTSSYDFTSSVPQSIELQSDPEGNFYLDSSGVRVPVAPISLNDARQAYFDETGQDFDFAGSAWSSAKDTLSPTYQGLTLDEANDRANYIHLGALPNDANYEEEFIIKRDFLPERTDWDTPHIQEIAGDDTNVIVHNYDDAGNYISTTIDTYSNLGLLEDGVQVDTTTEFSHRETIEDPLLVGTIGTAGVNQVLDSSSTYQASDALINSSTTTSDLVAKTASTSTDSLLGSILGKVSSSAEDVAKNLNVNRQVSVNTSSIDTNLAAIKGFLDSDLPLTDATDSDNFVNSIPSELDLKQSFKDSLAVNSATFDFDANQYTVDIFGATTCFNPSFDYGGKNYQLDMTYFCTALDFIGVILYAGSFYVAFLIVFGNRRV